MNVPIGDNSMYPSEYAVNGTLGWSVWPATRAAAPDDGQSSVVGPVSWSIWMETFLAAPLGWSSLLWQVNNCFSMSI